VFAASSLAADPPNQAALERRLVQSVGSQDPAILERAARRLGVAGLLRALDSSRRATVSAALEAAPLVQSAWLLLPRLVQQLGQQRARSLGSQAATAVLAITENLRLPDLERTEEVPVLMTDVSRSLTAVAADRRISLDIRVQTLLALAHLEDVVPQRPSGPLLGFLADPEERIREAAVELFAVGASAPALERLARVVTEDRSPRVARAAAVVLCARVAVVRPRRGRELELSAVRGVRAFPRIREMVEGLDASDDQLADLARCLVRSPDAEDRRALAQLRRRSVRLRRLLRRQLR